MEYPIYALDQKFMESIEAEWQSADTTIENFLENFYSNYNHKLKEFCVRGETGIFIDGDVVFELNNVGSGVRREYQWDYDCSRLLYAGKKNDLGLYQKDPDGNKIGLTHLQATDPRIWNYISLFLLNKYSQKRFGSSSNINRILLFSCSYENMSRHSITRLYWSAFLSDDASKGANRLDLLKVLWTNTDFMEKLLEVNISGKKQFLQWFLEFCQDPAYNSKLFKEKSIEKDWKYNKVKKLLVADNKVQPLANFTQPEANILFQANLNAC